MLVFASHAPSAFAGMSSLQPRNALPRLSAEEQYFLTLAEEHERAAAYARQRIQEARQRQQQHDLEAQLRLQQQLAASLQVRTPARSPYQTPTRNSFASVLPDMILEFDTEDSDACDGYAERMHRRSQVAVQERQKRAEEQSFLRALFEEQRRSQAERVAQLHRQRTEGARAERERAIEAQREAEQEQARHHLAARAAEEEKLRQFFQALMAASTETQGADLERKNAVRRNSDPAPAPTESPAPARPRTSSSAPTSPKAPTRAASPTPSTASDASDVSLSSIAQLQNKYASLRSSFSLPANLVFAPSSPSLLYNPVNAPVHAYEHALTSLLTELDAVESFGDDHVREVRRSLARSVEAELEALEEKKRETWKAQRESAPAPVEAIATPAVVDSVTVESSGPVAVEVSAPTPVQPESAPVEAESTPVESESTPVESIPVESIPIESATPAPEPIVLKSSSEPEVESVSEPEVIEHTPAESSTSATVAAPEPILSTTEPEPESTTMTEAEYTTTAEFETASLFPAPVPESLVSETESAPTTFVQVFPELESDSDSDDLVSELADRKSTSGGDEFEML